MSDFRFAGRWLNDRRVAGLAGDDFKAFVLAGAWMVENRSDGRISSEDLDFVPRFNRGSVPRLVAAGVWIIEGDGWLMVDYAGTQTSRAEFETLENARKRDREKKARQRATKRVTHDGHVTDDDMSRGTVPGDYTGKDRTGKEGKDYSEAQRFENAAPVLDWPAATIPNSVPVVVGYDPDEVF